MFLLLNCFQCCAPVPSALLAFQALLCPLNPTNPLSPAFHKKRECADTTQIEWPPPHSHQNVVNGGGGTANWARHFHLGHFFFKKASFASERETFREGRFFALFAMPHPILVLLPTKSIFICFFRISSIASPPVTSNWRLSWSRFAQFAAAGECFGGDGPILQV